MRLLDKLALNRLISIILNFILSMVKLFKPSSIDIDNPPPIIPLPPTKRKRWFPRGKNE
jgi:hypothetical protein